jgi:ATP/maltotriose-dependent transcriptional regulator MalT
VAEAAHRALDLLRPLGGPTAAIRRNLRRIARVCWFVGDGASAERYLEEAVESPWSGSEEDRLELATALAYRGLMAGIRQTLDDARPWLDEAMALVEGVDDRRLQALVLNDVGTVRYLHEGDDTDLLRSVELAEQVGLHIDVVRGHVNLASCGLAHRRYEVAASHLERAAIYAERHQVAAFEALAGAVRAQIEFETGRWGAAEEHAAAVVRHPSFAQLPASVVLARLKVRRGDHDAGEAIADAVARAERTGEAQRLVPAIGAAAEHAWMLGRLAEVVPSLERAHALAVASGSPRFVGETAIWLQAAGRLDEIPHRIEPAARLLLEGRWEEAADAWQRLDAPYESAVARVLADDVDVILAGLAELDRMGAQPMARKTRNRLGRMGVDRIPRGPRPTTASNPAGLTSRQVEVAGLVADGLTNGEIAERLFLSARTVDHHVAAILLKLEVDSRRQVAGRAAELGLFDP